HPDHARAQHGNRFRLALIGENSAYPHDAYTGIPWPDDSAGISGIFFGRSIGAMCEDSCAFHIGQWRCGAASGKGSYSRTWRSAKGTLQVLPALRQYSRARRVTGAQPDRPVFITADGFYSRPARAARAVHARAAGVAPETDDADPSDTVERSHRDSAGADSHNRVDRILRSPILGRIPRIGIRRDWCRFHNEDRLVRAAVEVRARRCGTLCPKVRRTVGVVRPPRLDVLTTTCRSGHAPP